MDWSDHALWWPARNHWLTRTRSTLDQYGVAADALLHFTPMHKTLRVQLPDTRCLDCRVDFSVKTFNAIINLCKELGKSRTSINIGLRRRRELIRQLLSRASINDCEKQTYFCTEIRKESFLLWNVSKLEENL